MSNVLPTENMKSKRLFKKAMKEMDKHYANRKKIIDEEDLKLSAPIRNLGKINE